MIYLKNAFKKVGGQPETSKKAKVSKDDSNNISLKYNEEKQKNCMKLDDHFV